MLKKLKWRWKKMKLRRTYQPDLKELEKTGKREDHDRLDAEYGYFLQELREEQRLYTQQQLIKKASQLYISAPPYMEGDFWKQGGTQPQLLLTDKAMNEMNRQIREELKARRDFMLGWISPFTGIIGTLVGFLLGRLSN